MTGSAPSRTMGCKLWPILRDACLMRCSEVPNVTDGAFLYILRCSDGSYYIGTTRTALETRIAEHNAGTLGGYTSTRRPVTLVYSQWFDRITDAIENERKLKRWSRAKKEALIKVTSKRCGNSRREDYPTGAHSNERALARVSKDGHSTRPMVRDGADAPPHHEVLQLASLLGACRKHAWLCRASAPGFRGRRRGPGL
jgi:putative endonuclease